MAYLSVLDDPDHPDALIASQAAAHRILMQHGFKAKCFQEGRMRRYARTPEAEVDTSSPNFWKLCDLIQRGLKRITEKALSRLEGKSTDPFFDELDRTAETARPYAPEAGEQSLSLNQIFEEWVEDRKPSEKTRRAWAAAVRRFGEVNGDLAVASITTLHISKFKKVLSQLPAKLPHHIRKMPVPEIIKATKGEGRSALSPAAVKKEIAAISSLMSWAVKNGYRGDNPAAGVEVPNANTPERERVPFSGDELSRIFRDLRKFRRLEPSKYWLPQLALMTGARQRELGQLLVEDVKDENGIAYIDIKKGEGKSLKTRSSARQVPLHPTLIKNGFLDYVKEQKERGERLLFPDLKPDTLGSPTGNFSKWFGRRLQKLGIRDFSKDERRDFHSLRHNFKEACRNARIEEEVHDALTGHAPTNVGRRYGGVPLELKATEIAKVQYLGLDLPPLCLNSEDPPDPTSERNGEVPSE